MAESKISFVLEILREIGFDLGLIYGVPWVKSKLTGKHATAEEKQVLEEASKLLKEGKREEARNLLARGIFGIGLADEQVLDETLAAVGRAKMVRPKQLDSLDKWLASNQMIRARFRNSLTLQKSPQARMEVVSEYARMSNAQRMNRLTATGKLDPEVGEIIWEWVKTNIPGISRDVWDGACDVAEEVWDVLLDGATATGRGLTAGVQGVARGAVWTDSKLDRIGLILQVNARQGMPSRRRRGRRRSRGFMGWFENLFA